MSLGKVAISGSAAPKVSVSERPSTPLVIQQRFPVRGRPSTPSFQQHPAAPQSSAPIPSSRQHSIAAALISASESAASIKKSPSSHTIPSSSHVIPSALTPSSHKASSSSKHASSKGSEDSGVSAWDAPSGGGSGFFMTEIGLEPSPAPQPPSPPRPSASIQHNASHAAQSSSSPPASIEIFAPRLPQLPPQRHSPPASAPPQPVLQKRPPPAPATVKPNHISSIRPATVLAARPPSRSALMSRGGSSTAQFSNEQIERIIQDATKQQAQRPSSSLERLSTPYSSSSSARHDLPPLSFFNNGQELNRPRTGSAREGLSTPSSSSGLSELDGLDEDSIDTERINRMADTLNREREARLATEKEIILNQARQQELLSRLLPGDRTRITEDLSRSERMSDRLAQAEQELNSLRNMVSEISTAVLGRASSLGESSRASSKLSFTRDHRGNIVIQ